MEQMEAQVQNCGGTIVVDNVINIDKPGTTNDNDFLVKLENGEEYLAETVIVCTGATAKWLGLETEQKFMGYGVSGCATCDGFFYRGKEVIVVGGGNTAAEEALYLTNHASKVILIHRRDTLRAEKTLQNRVLTHPKIEVMWDSVLEEVLGNDQPSVTGAKIKNVKTEQVTEIAIDGIFIAIGHAPNTSLLTKFSELRFDAAGYLITQPNSTKTEIPGLFAAGDLQDGVFRQAVTAAGTGCMAALEAEKYISERSAVTLAKTN